jgi:hypothetical protein
MSPRLVAVLAFLSVVSLSVLSTAAPAAAQGLPNREQSVVLLNIVALKGAECGLLRPWETEIIRSMAEQDMLSWDEPRKARVAAETDTRLAETNCDSTSVVSVWIEGARRGIATEYLSLYLVIYSTMLRMDDPPAIFTELAKRDSPAEDIATIEAAMAAIAASDAKPDGGGAWPEFIESTSETVREFAPLLDAGGAPPDAVFAIRHAIAITELWLADQDIVDGDGD